MEISIPTLSLMRHPGDVANFDEYRQHLPEQWCPMLSVIGSVPSGGSNSTDPSEPRHFIIETSVYDASKAAPVQFLVSCFLENTKRWEKVKTPQSGAFLSVTAKLAGRTLDTNQLALRVLDLTYLPRPNSTASVLTPATTPPSKRSRWEGRALFSTPSKKPRTSNTVGGITTPLGKNITLPEMTQAGFNLSPTEDTIEALSNNVTRSPSTTADHEQSPINSTSQVSSDSAARPHRNRHAPRQFDNLE